MLDVRYHWLTLAALFFALGLGIAIGVSVGERGTLAEEQVRLAERLQERLGELREENRALRQAERRLEAARQAAEERAERIAQAAVEGRLAGRTFLLTAPGAAASPARAGALADSAQRWRLLLERAGATVLPADGAAPALPVEEVVAWAAARGQGAGSQGEWTAIYINPPPNVPIPDGWKGAVVWDGVPEQGGMEGVLPSHWFSLRAGRGAFPEWVFVEGLYRGWQGFVDAAAEEEGRGFPWARLLGEKRDGR